MQARIDRFRTAVRQSAEGIAALEDQLAVISAIADEVVGALRNDHKILTAGNGGSAAEALHMAEELVGRYRSNRRALPAVALVADTTALTCIGNDFGYDAVFERQVEALGAAGDVLAVFSTSGRAANLRRAVGAARDRGMRSVCLLGRDGGALAGMGDRELIVAGTDTERIQEVHQVVLHLVLDAVEEAFA